ncbi:MAG: hypothetical protein MUE40_13150 [Anaerolineae bacterium]|nr:hypothetical protein [Anaerolineae bacterium]
MQERRALEKITAEIMEVFEVYAPPVPIELMLHNPAAGMWDKIDVTQLSGSFLSIKDRFSPRMSMARLLARHIAVSDWGRKRGLFTLLQQQDNLQLFARMLVMPGDMVQGLTSSTRNPAYISTHFEVPEDDAGQRLLELLD